MRTHWTASLAIIASLGTGSASALSPTEVFEKVSPSVWSVRPLDGFERPMGIGSGVVIGPGRLITNCHVLAKAKGIQVRKENVAYDAKLEDADTERDLCTLTIKGFTAPAVQIRPLADVKVGERVYAVGNPLGFSLTLSEGLISGLRSADPKLPPVQTSAPVSPGSSGGGLFDDQGRLIAITTSSVVDSKRIAQNLNFAMPADWIAEIPERAKEALARRRAPATASSGPGGNAASSLLPSAGTKYRYALRDHQYSRRQEFSVQVNSVDGWNVSESFTVQDSPTTSATTVPARDVAFFARQVADGRSLLELAPYFPIEVESRAPEFQTPPPFPAPDGYGAWSVGLRHSDWEEVAVPAGTFRAYRLALGGSRHVMAFGAYTIPSMPERFEYTVWYAPEVKRYVKIRHQVWSVLKAPLADDQIELLEYGWK